MNNKGPIREKLGVLGTVRERMSKIAVRDHIENI
jgi:hypothetical protein